MPCAFPVPIPGPTSIDFDHKKRCLSLVQNPSFEAGLAEWITSDNLSTIGEAPFEGNQVARMPEGVAHMFQDVYLPFKTNCSLFLSFNVFGVDPVPNLTVEILWLNAHHQAIATGLRMFIPEGTITGTSNARITYFDITDFRPEGAAFARILFSKREGTFIDIDQVILTPVLTPNLVQNASFEVGLASWNSNTFIPNFRKPLQGAADVIAAQSGTLFQDVSIADQPPNSPYLLSFGAFSEGLLFLTIQVQWLDTANNIIGSPGLELTIPNETLKNQESYLTYLDITDRAPLGAVTARILFSPDIGPDSGSTLKVDKVILVRVTSTNLVSNPSFEDDLNDWTVVNTSLITEADVYEGDAAALVNNFGGVTFQDVPIANAADHCFLFNCGIRIFRFGMGGAVSNVLVKVLWLDNSGREIGEGLSLVCFGQNDVLQFPKWLIYTGITEPAPLNTAAARIQFTKLFFPNGFLEIDKVVLGRLV